MGERLWLGPSRMKEVKYTDNWEMYTSEGTGRFSQGEKKSKFYSWEESKLVNLPSIVNDAITSFKFI